MFLQKRKAMGKHRTSDVIEAIFWLALAVIFFSVSFQFNQPLNLQIWCDRLAARCSFLDGCGSHRQFLSGLYKGAVAQKGRVGASEEAEQFITNLSRNICKLRGF